MRVIFDEMGKYKKEVIGIIITSLVGAVFTMAIPKIMQGLIDEAIPMKDYAEVFVIAGRMIICIVIVLISGIYGARFSAYVSMGVGKNMRKAIFEKVQSFSEYEIDYFSTSSLISRTNSDIHQVQLFLSLGLRVAITTPTKA